MKLQGLVFGIRVTNSFYLEDKLGAIVDELLYSKDSAFGPSMFPTVQESNSAKMLYNEKTGDKLTLTHSDFILEYTIQKDFEYDDSDDTLTITGVAFNDPNKRYKVVLS